MQFSGFEGDSGIQAKTGGTEKRLSIVKGFCGLWISRLMWFPNLICHISLYCIHEFCSCFASNTIYQSCASSSLHKAKSNIQTPHYLYLYKKTPMPFPQRRMTARVLQTHLNKSHKHFRHSMSPRCVVLRPEPHSQTEYPRSC